MRACCFTLFLQINEEVLRDLAFPALRSGDADAQDIIENFLDQGLETDEAKFSFLGKKWSQLKKSIKKAKASKVVSPWSAQDRHGLTPLEFKYMKTYRKYQALKTAYKRGCVRSRFWLRLHKWHWRILLAAHKKLRRMVNQYARLRAERDVFSKKMSKHFSWIKTKPAFKSFKFLTNIIGFAKAGVQATADKAKASEKENDANRKAALELAKMLPPKQKD